MTGAGECAEVRRELGVYVLGSISPADRAAVERHLPLCAECREEVAALAGLPALLRRLSADAAIQFPADEAAGPGPGLGAAGPSPGALLNQVAALRRRRGWRRAAAASVLAVAAVTGWGLQVWHPRAIAGGAPAQPWAAVAEGVNPATKTGVTVRYTAEAWGTAMQIHVTGIPPGTPCQVWVTGTRDQRVAAGAWTVAGSESRDWYPASASVPVTLLRSFAVSAGRTVLVAIPLH